MALLISGLCLALVFTKYATNDKNEKQVPMSYAIFLAVCFFSNLIVLIVLAALR